MKRKTFEYSSSKTEDFGVVVEKNDKKLSDKYKYIHKNVFYRFFSALFYYSFALPVLWCVGKLLNGVKVVNKKNLKPLKKTGYFIYSNHTLWLDGFTQHVFTCNPKRVVVVSLADTFTCNKLLGSLLTFLGGMPLPTSFRTAKKFLHAMEYHLDHNKVIAIYPEGTIWPYYTGQRAIKKGAFKYPVTFDKPVVFACTTYREPKGLFKKIKNPKMVITLSEPIYPSRNGVKKIDEERLEVLYKEFIEKVSSSPDNYAANNYVPKKLDKDYIDYLNEALDVYNLYDDIQLQVEDEKEAKSSKEKKEK